jgi:hypothetical protein
MAKGFEVEMVMLRGRGDKLITDFLRFFHKFVTLFTQFGEASSLF